LYIVLMNNLASQCVYYVEVICLLAVSTDTEECFLPQITGNLVLIVFYGILLAVAAKVISGEWYGASCREL